MNKCPMEAIIFRLLTLLNVLFVVCSGAAARGQSPGSKPEPTGQREISIRVGADGLPAQIEAKQGPPSGILAAPCRLYLKSSEEMIPVPPLHETGPGEWTVDWQAQHLFIAVTYGKSPDTSITLSVQSLASQARRVQLELTLALNPEADHAFFPAGRI